MDKYAIGRNIERLIKARNMTKQRLAREIGVGHDTMSKCLNGKRQITAYELYRVSKVLRVTMESLMVGVEKEWWEEE